MKSYHKHNYTTDSAGSTLYKGRYKNPQLHSVYAFYLPKVYVARQMVSKNRYIGKCRPIVGRRRHWLWLIFGSADGLYVEETNLKVPLTGPPIFMGCIIGEASPNDRPTVGRISEEITIMRSPDHRVSIGRRSPDNREITFDKNRR